MTNIKKISLSAMFLCIGLVLPFLTGQLQTIGNMLLPMHLPVLLCGLILGAKYGFATGIILPVLRSLIFTKPPMYPNAVIYAVELCTYGLVIGLVYKCFAKKNVGAVYASLVSAMISGRIVWAAAKNVVLGLSGKSFTFEMFLSGAFLEAIPGIILQLVLIPVLMVVLQRAGYLPEDKNE